MRHGAVGRRPYGTELEAVAGERKGRCAVAVGVVDKDFGNLRQPQGISRLSGKRRKIGVAAVLEHVKHGGQLAAGEDGDYCRRRLVGSETVSVGGTHDGCFQKAVEAVDSSHDIDNECDELQIVLRSLTGSEQQNAGVRAKAPVVVLA